MRKYRISVDFNSEGYNVYGNIFLALYEFYKNINSGATIKITNI